MTNWVDYYETQKDDQIMLEVNEKYMPNTEWSNLADKSYSAKVRRYGDSNGINFNQWCQRKEYLCFCLTDIIVINKIDFGVSIKTSVSSPLTHRENREKIREWEKGRNN